MLISDFLHVLHFLYHCILKTVETFLWYFKQLPAKIDNDNDFKKFRIKNVKTLQYRIFQKKV